MKTLEIKRSPARQRQMRTRTGRLLGLAVVAFLVKIIIAATTYGTNDVATFEGMQDKFRSKGAYALYQEGGESRYDGRLLAVLQMNHPPFVLHLFQFWNLCHRIFGGPFRFWLRFTCACADLFSFWLVWLLFRDAPDNFWALAFLSVAPLAVMISGFHGNTDPIMIAFVVAAAYSMDRKLPPWLAGAAFGVACSIKVWPLVLMPVFLLSAVTWKRRAQFLGSLAAVAFLFGLPWILTLHNLIAHRVFGYSPVQGWWGFSYAFPGHGRALRTIVFAVVWAAAAYMHERVQSVFVQCAIVSFLFLFFTPGFGPQYLAWLVPWTVAAEWQTAGLFHLTAGLYAFQIYTAWSTRMPWYFANAFVYPIPQWVLRAGLLAWLLLLPMAFLAYRRHTQPGRDDGPIKTGQRGYCGEPGRQARMMASNCFP